MPFQGSAQISAAKLQFKGSATDQLADVSAHVVDLPLNLGAPYVDECLAPRLDGLLKADLSLTLGRCQHHAGRQHPFAACQPESGHTGVDGKHGQFAGQYQTASTG
jgi:hypothetical protein